MTGKNFKSVLFTVQGNRSKQRYQNIPQYRSMLRKRKYLV